MCTVHKAHMLKYHFLTVSFDQWIASISLHVDRNITKRHHIRGGHWVFTIAILMWGSQSWNIKIFMFLSFSHILALISSAENVRLLMSIISVKDHYYFRLGHCTSTGDKIQRGAENWCCDWIGPQNGTSPSPPWTDRHI